MKLKLVLLMLLGLLSSQLFADHETLIEEEDKQEVEEFDSKRIAQVIGGIDLSSAVTIGYANFFSNRKGRWVNGFFTLNRDGRITSLTLDDKVIIKDGDRPVETFPTEIEGYRDFDIYVMMRQNNNDVAWASFYTPLLLPKHVIEFKMRPDKPMVIHISAPGDVDDADLKPSKLCLDDFENWCSDFNPDTRGYDIYVPARYPKYPYTIYGSDGEKLYKGTINPLDPYPNDRLESSFSMEWLGGIEVIYFNRYSLVTLEEEILDGKTKPANCLWDWCEKVPAATYLVETNKGMLEVRIDTDDKNVQMIIDIYEWKEYGWMPIIVSGIIDQTSIGTGFKKVIVVVRRNEILADTNETDLKFGVEFIIRGMIVPTEEEPKKG